VDRESEANVNDRASTRPASSHELWMKVHHRYRAVLDAIEEVQSELPPGSQPKSRWPHAREVAARMGVSPSTVRRIVRDWDRFVDVANVELRDGVFGQPGITPTAPPPQRQPATRRDPRSG
jgi:hypothetical protein